MNQQNYTLIENYMLSCMEDSAHGKDHIYRVLYQALEIAKTEENVDYDVLITACLLHDVGRWMQYKEGIPHEKAGVMLAEEILIDCGYEPEECSDILEAIGNHRNAGIKDEKNLSGLLYRADKLSRACFACGAESECDWKQDKKNMEILW